jgi:thiamine monophosphate synthase
MINVFDNNSLQANLAVNKPRPNIVLFSDRARIGDLPRFLLGFIDKSQKKAVIYREYDLDKTHRKAELSEIYRSFDKNQLILINAHHYNISSSFLRCGIHSSDRKKSASEKLQFLQLATRYRNSKRLVTFASHSFKSLLQASKNCNIDIIFISPVFSTKSHPQQKPIPLLQLTKFMTKNQLKENANIFALGGINEKNIKILPKLGFKGFGGIEIFSK